MRGRISPYFSVAGLRMLRGMVNSLRCRIRDIGQTITIALCLNEVFIAIGRHPVSLTPPSVLILKFLCSGFVIADCSAAEALDRSEDVVGRFCPSERFWIGVTDLDTGVDRGFQLSRRSMHAPFDLLL